MAALPLDALHRGPAPAADGGVFPIKEDDDNRQLSWFSSLAFVFLTYNTFFAISRSIPDFWAVSFAAISYVDLLVLFWCLRKFERADERTKEKLKFAVWILSTVLTAMFTYRVAVIMPRPVAVAVVVLGSATTIGGFCALLVCRDRVDACTGVDKKNPLRK